VMRALALRSCGGQGCGDRAAETTRPNDAAKHAPLHVHTITLYGSRLQGKADPDDRIRRGGLLPLPSTSTGVH
jgi:hypothetical protein